MMEGLLGEGVGSVYRERLTICVYALWLWRFILLSRVFRGA